MLTAWERDPVAYRGELVVSSKRTRARRVQHLLANRALLRRNESP